MRKALGDKNKLPIIDGLLEILYFNDMNQVAWERCNHLVHYFLVNYVSDSITQTIIFMKFPLLFEMILKKGFLRLIKIV